MNNHKDKTTEKALVVEDSKLTRRVIVDCLNNEI